MQSIRNSASYTAGGMTISANYARMENGNCNYSTAR